MLKGDPLDGLDLEHLSDNKVQQLLHILGKFPILYDGQLG